ncbi:hypothetical protein KI387_041669, partial [Taxus chinensis]
MDKDSNPSTAIEKEKPKEMKAEGSSSRTRKRKECNIPDEKRCKRLDRKKNWRCVNARVNKNYCQHHIELMSKNYLSRRERKKKEEENKIVAVADPIPGLKQEKTESQAVPVTDPSPCTKQAVGIARRSINNVGLIKNPELAEEIMVPSEISDLKERLPVMLMDAWNEVLSPAERYRLRSFLPEGHKEDETVVMSLLKGETSRFGVGIADKWRRRLCEGKQTPEAVMQKERELKIFSH